MKTFTISSVLIAGLISFFVVSRNEIIRTPASSFPKYIVDDNLRLFSFDKDKSFYISNAKTSAKLIIHHNIPGEKNILLKLDCENFEETIDTSVRFGKSRSIVLPTNIDKCLLRYTGKTSGSTSEITITSESSAFPVLNEYRSAKEIGKFSSSDVLPIQKYFVSNTLNNTTGVLETDNYKALDTREAGFLEKMKALVGYDLGEDFIKNQNPYAEIDFSKAPKLDAVFVSTLVYRADFYGTVLARALEYQADHGAVVHIITTGYMMLEKDKNLLEPLAFFHPNIRLQEFIYNDPSYDIGRPFRFISSKYRDMHVKMFVTTSKEHPKDNVIIFGGRNVHDGFLFKTLPDHSKYPKLVHYGKGKDDDFVSWNDFEMKLTSKEIAESTYAHLLRFWHRDTYTQFMDNATTSTTNEILSSESNKSFFRHIISIPYNDGQALEKTFVDMIDKASVSIKISSPYLRPTPAISDALGRAILRGVKIDIQTRINLEGDTQAWLYSEVNKESINKFYKKIKIYEWKENSILHSKFILIDGKVAFIGSVNLSRRSFVQDVENGFLIHSENIVKKMDAIFESYIAKSQKIESAQSRKYTASILIYFLKNQF